MPTYEYDDFGITLRTLPDGTHELEAVSPDGTTHTRPFLLPLTTRELEARIIGMARARSRKALDAHGPTREVGESDTIAPNRRDENAEQLGAALADALLAGDVGAAYDAARRASARARRGLRLTLTLGDAPDLLDLPWEFLYRRPRFIASQRHTPLVRRMRAEATDEPPRIDGAVRILGVVASPTDLRPLDTVEERRRVEDAVAPMVEEERVELSWLESATPRRLRETLRDERFHVLHFVGHSDFGDGEGVLFLEDDDRRKVPVDATMLANLVSDQTGLRLVVLNSCEGARNTVQDPYAGIATTLIQLGVPAVVAMQFEISDGAAIRFAEEFYTDLIARQDPIDSAVAEARKAIYIEINRFEFATPVLFVRDPTVELFRFRVAPGSVPPLPPPDLSSELDALADESEPSATEPAAVEPAAGEPPSGATRPPEVAATEVSGVSEGDERDGGGRVPRWTKIAGGAVLGTAVAAIAAAALIGNGDGPEPGVATAPDVVVPPTAVTGETTAEPAPPETTPPTAPPTTPPPTSPPEPRPRFGNIAVEVLRDNGDTHIKSVDLETGVEGNLTDRSGATDTQADWDPSSSRIAFVRSRDVDGVGTRLNYAADGDRPNGIGGKNVAPLIPWEPGQYDHAPAWMVDGSLLYARSDGCVPDTRCPETIHRAQFGLTVDRDGYLDELVLEDDERVLVGVVDVTAIAAHPTERDRFAVADASGVWFVRIGDDPKLVLRGVLPRSMAFTGDGERFVALVDAPDGQVFHVVSEDGSPLFVSDPSGTPLLSITASDGGRELMVLLGVPIDRSGSLLVEIGVGDDGTIDLERVVPVVPLPAGTPRAIDL